MSATIPNPGFVSMVAAMVLIPCVGSARGWEPTQQTVDELINGGFGFFLFSYIAQGMAWVSRKLGPPWWFRGTREEWDERYRMTFGANATAFDVIRFTAAAAVMLGGFAWLVGWMKGTL